MSYYAVGIGRNPGIYYSWNECEQNVKGFKGATHRKFKTLNEASEFINMFKHSNTQRNSEAPSRPINHTPKPGGNQHLQYYHSFNNVSNRYALR